MSRLGILLFVLALLIGGGIAYSLQIEGQFSLPDTLQRVGVPLDKIPTLIVNLPPITLREKVLPEGYQGGNSRFSQGACVRDADCMATGCSREVCGTEEEITTCEFGYNFPNTNKYDCGCVNNFCGWSEKE